MAPTIEREVKRELRTWVYRNMSESGGHCMPFNILRYWYLVPDSKLIATKFIENFFHYNLN